MIEKDNSVNEESKKLQLATIKFGIASLFLGFFMGIFSTLISNYVFETDLYFAKFIFLLCIVSMAANLFDWLDEHLDEITGEKPIKPIKKGWISDLKDNYEYVLKHKKRFFWVLIISLFFAYVF